MGLLLKNKNTREKDCLVCVCLCVCLFKQDVYEPGRQTLKHRWNELMLNQNVRFL